MSNDSAVKNTDACPGSDYAGYQGDLDGLLSACYYEIVLHLEENRW